MKLALLYHQFIKRGGLEGYLREFAGHLQGEGHELIFVTSRVDEDLKKLASEVRIIPPALSSRGTLARFAARSAELVPELKVDAVLGFGRTWRQDVHRAGGGSHWHYDRLLPWYKSISLKNRLELRLERKLYTGGQTRHFVVNSAKVRDELAEAWNVPASRVSIIHTAVDTGFWRPAESADSRKNFRARQGIPPDVPLLLFASLDHRRKGLGTLLEAMSRVPEVHLCVAGQEIASWLPVIRKWGLATRVTATGRTSLLPWYQAADWFVHPTRYDACANTVLQSMACGLPGIISTGDGAAGFVADSLNGFLLRDPEDAAELADLIRRATAIDETRRLTMGDAARKTLLPLTWQAHLQSWMTLLGDLRAGA